MREEFVEYWKRAHNKAAAEVALQEEQAVLADRVIQKEESTTDVDGVSIRPLTRQMFLV